MSETSSRNIGPLFLKIKTSKVYTRIFKAAIPLSCILIAVYAYFTLNLGNWSSDYDMLYSHPNAVASYLSLTGFEGVTTSHLFVLAARRLAQSWTRNVDQKSREKYDMVLIIADPYRLLTPESASLLRSSGWMLIRVEPLYGTPSASNYLNQNRYTHTAQFTKLWLWTLDGYSHILYLDSDMLIIKNVTSAISTYKTSSINNLGVAGNDEKSMLNAGLLLINPSIDVFNSMKNALVSIQYDPEYQEQAFLDAFWKSAPYNITYMPSELNEGINNLTPNCVVMHFISHNKPWTICNNNDPGKTSWPCIEWDSYD